MKKVENAKKELENVFNAPVKIVENAAKITVKQITPELLKQLIFISLHNRITIKRSGTGVTVIAQPI